MINAFTVPSQICKERRYVLNNRVSGKACEAVGDSDFAAGDKK